MATPIPSNIADLAGPLFLGFILNWYLFGINTLQTYMYFQAFPKDRRETKILVAIMFFMELFQTTFSLVDAFRWFGSHWGNMDELNKVGMTWFTTVIWGPLIALVAQVFYAWRMWVLSKRVIFPIIIILLGLFQCISGFWAGIALYKFGLTSGTGWHNIILLSTSLWLAGTATCDVIITACMVYCLMKSHTGIKSTDTILTRLTRYAIETGLATSVVAIADLALFHLFPALNIHLVACYILTKAYSNSLLAVLNSRARFVSRAAFEDNAPDYPSLSWAANSNLASGPTLSKPYASGVTGSSGTVAMIHKEQSSDKV